MPGNAVAEELKKRDPDIATVLISGWGLDEGDPRLTVFDLSLKKPLNLEDLEEAVSQAAALHDERLQRPIA